MYFKQRSTTSLLTLSLPSRSVSLSLSVEESKINRTKSTVDLERLAFGEKSKINRKSHERVPDFRDVSWQNLLFICSSLFFAANC